MPNAPTLASITVNTDNATPTATTKDILPLVRVTCGILPNDTTQDANLALLFDAALEKYNELAPLIKRTPPDFVTVAGQLAYPLPGDCVSVYDVAVPSQYGYYNDWLFLPMIDTPASSLFGYSDYAFRAPSERLIREGILTELDHYAQSWAGYYVDGTPLQLYILPTSVASGLPIQVRYGSYITDSGTDPMHPVLTSLPTGHWRYLLRLVKWALNDQRAEQLAANLNLSQQGAGATMMTESWKNANRAERLLNEVRQALGADRTVALRS